MRSGRARSIFPAVAAAGAAGAAALAATWLAAAGPAGRLSAAAVPAASGAGAGYWHTSGNQILDANGTPVRIAGVNWYGFETPDEVAHGPWAQDYHMIIDDIRNLGYNTIRIPFSNQMVESPIVPQNLSFYNSGPINTDLEGPELAPDPGQDRGVRGAGRPEGHPGRPPLGGGRVGRAERPVVQVTAASESYNATIGPAGSVTIGFTGTYTASNVAPASFSVNGTAC